MSINNYWRNKQLNHALLWQESRCLDFCQQHKNITWKWYGSPNYFFDLCKSVLTVGPNNDGIIIINTPVRVSVDHFVKQISSLIQTNIKVAYLAINRYEFKVDSIDSSLPDSPEQCLDLIANKCHKDFRRLYVPTEVDGNHFVGVHGLDVFVYENY